MAFLGPVVVIGRRDRREKRRHTGELTAQHVERVATRRSQRCPTADASTEQVTEGPPVQLAEHGDRQVVRELDELGHLVGREVTGAVLHECRWVDRLAGDDDRTDPFTELHVGQSDHADIHDTRVGPQHLLDLDGPEFLAPRLMVSDSRPARYR